MDRSATARKYVMDQLQEGYQLNIGQQKSQSGVNNCSQVPTGELLLIVVANMENLGNFFGVEDMMIAVFIIGAIGEMVNGGIQTFTMHPIHHHITR